MLAPVAAAGFFGRSHLSPDGGGFTRAAVHRLAADGYDLAAGAFWFPGRSHLSPDGGEVSRGRTTCAGSSGVANRCLDRFRASVAAMMDASKLGVWIGFQAPAAGRSDASKHGSRSVPGTNGTVRFA